MDEQPLVLQVGPESAGLRLDKFISSQLPALSRVRCQQLIREGRIRLQGNQVKPSETVALGDAVDVDEPEPPAPVPMEAEAIAMDILFEDASFLVINKPAGLVVHPGAGHLTGTVVNAVLHHCDDLSGIGGEERPGIVHRLDKETSGCLVIAKSDVAHQALSRQFADRTILKNYLAVVEGIPRRLNGTINAAIGRHHIHRQKMTVSDRPGARESETHYRVLASGEGLALLLCTPKTGRTHQIRVHLKHLGHPIAGDPVYGKRGRWERHLLHAWKLGFRHPVSGEELVFTSPVPDDFPLVPPPEKSQNPSHGHFS